MQTPVPSSVTIVFLLGERREAEGHVLEKREPEGEGRGQVPGASGHRPLASPHRADEVVPVLAPHVRTACDVDGQLLVGSQHALGNVGKEGSSFPVRQHVFHKIWGRTRKGQ